MESLDVFNKIPNKVSNWWLRKGFSWADGIGRSPVVWVCCVNRRTESQTGIQIDGRAVPSGGKARSVSLRIYLIHN